MRQKLENTINRNINSLEERFCPTGHVSRALKHFWLSQMRAYYWHRVSRSVQDAATEQENHLPHPPKTAPTCQHKLRNPELGYERPCMSCLHALSCWSGYYNLGSVREISIFLPTFLVNLHRKEQSYIPQQKHQLCSHCTISSCLYTINWFKNNRWTFSLSEVNLLDSPMAGKQN